MSIFERTHANASCAPDLSADGLVAPDDAVLALRLAGGFQLFCRHDQLRQDFPQLSNSSSTRGLGDAILEGLDVFHIKPQEGLAHLLAAKIESHLDRPPGRYRLSLTPPLDLSNAPQSPDPTHPALVFIHGTGSSTRGSYLPLAIPEFATQIEQAYGANVFAYEHKTLTESPIQNALQLAESLAPNTQLDLVTHSRGGLIGDLLCLGQLRSPFDSAFIEELFGSRPSDRAALLHLIDLLKSRSIVVRRFARVASPARGTTLASGRADRWFSMLLSLFGLLLKELPASPILDSLFEALQDFTIAVAHQRTNPAIFPGLEAMLPESPLIRLLNHPGAVIDANLTVIAGSTESTQLLGQLKYLVPGQFYGGRNDLVVNYASMDGGLPRSSARLFSDSGPNVNHFHYFTNPKTRQAVLETLLGLDATNAGFEVFSWKPVFIPARGASESPSPSPDRVQISEPRLRVTIAHADLSSAAHPIAIGHYAGDSMVGAEAALDRLLKGRLGLHHKLGVYPNQIRESDVFLKEESGAIVMGLGSVGSLTPKLLEQTYTNAALKYALQGNNTRLSTLLIGTMANVLTIDESLIAMLRAVRGANRVSPRPIDSLEIIELWEDRAIQTADALARLAETPEWKNVLDAPDTVDIRAGGLRRYAPSNEDEGWWNRLRITQKKPSKPLHFALITNRARTEIETVREPQRAAGLIEAAIATTFERQQGLASALRTPTA